MSLTGFFHSQRSACLRLNPPSELWSWAKGKKARGSYSLSHFSVCIRLFNVHFLWYGIRKNCWSLNCTKLSSLCPKHTRTHSLHSNITAANHFAVGQDRHSVSEPNPWRLELASVCMCERESGCVCVSFGCAPCVFWLWRLQGWTVSAAVQTQWKRVSREAVDSIKTSKRQRDVKMWRVNCSVDEEQRRFQSEKAVNMIGL